MKIIRGRDGRDGKRGPAGSDGESIVGPPGPAGESIVGPKGDPGRDGRDGIDGCNGKDADPKMIRALVEETVNRIEIPEPIEGKSGESGQTGPMPQHEWRDTALRFEQQPGQWGRFVDLKGDRGDPGETRVVHTGGGGGMIPAPQPSGDRNVFIQPSAPVTSLPEYLWIQTGLGPIGNDMTFWVFS